MNKQSKMSVSNAIMLVMALVLCVAVMFAACTPEQPTPQPSVTLKSIAVTIQPAKTSYVEGEKFDKAGMVVTAKYSDETSKAVTNYTDAKLIAELSAGLGEAMVGINEQEIALLMAERGK